MFIFKKHISRRTVLKGAGVSVALPFLEAMVPAATALAQTAANPKIRAGFFYIPHGAVQHDTKFGPEGDKWTPSGSGASFKLNRITAPLEPFKKYVSTIGNLDNPNGSGVHTRNPGTWLNCNQNTTTIDQIIAKKISQDTALPSLEVSAETTTQQAAGNGVGTASTVSFNGSTPLPMEYNPKKVFNTLFGTTTPKERVLNAREADSLLDLILERTKSFQSQLGAADRVALDQYLENVREIERRTQIIANIDISNMKIPERPVGVEDNFDKQVDLLFDLIAVAYQADITRVASFVMVAEGTNQTYNHIGVPDSFHPISHHANEPDKIERVVKIQTWHMDRFAEFLKKMAATKDGDGSLLDHSIFLYGSNMGNSDRHSNWPIPTVVVGGGNGKMKLVGQHIEPKDRKPLANVHLTLLNKFGIEQEKFADSNGIFSEL
ncbi:MAG TPA: DUF1552 domain-containing protein [Terriglobia bacterium]|nr:DUF1552 domain-containing protein [Terriglobia bacterium]